MAFKLLRKSPKADRPAKPQAAATRPDDLSAAVNAWQGHGFAASIRRSARSERDAKRGTVTYVDDLASTSPSSSTASAAFDTSKRTEQSTSKTATAKHVAKSSAAGSDALSQALHGYKGCTLSA